jgi:hypothetical protein
VNFSEREPSNEWTALKHTEEEIAEAWFKPEEDPLTLLLRVPQSRFQVDDISQQLTLEDLLNAADIANEDVESWQHGNESHVGMDGTNPELRRLLPPPPPDATHLGIYVRLKPPAQAAGHDERSDEEVQFQALEACWRGVLGLEVSIDTLRMNMDTLRAEMEAAVKKALTVEEKVSALQADVVQWNKAKSRIQFALPKAREYIHRATWALGIPERKRLEEVVENYIEPRIPFPDIDQVREQLGHLQKDRQVLFGQGTSVYQDCRILLAEIQRCFSTLQRNAANRAREKRSAGREKGKHL